MTEGSTSCTQESLRSVQQRAVDFRRRGVFGLRACQGACQLPNPLIQHVTASALACFWQQRYNVRPLAGTLL